MSESISVYLDQNNRTSTAAGYYMDRLRSAMAESVPSVELVDTVAKADVIHYNDLNLWSAVVSGKESRLEHAKLVASSIVKYRNKPVVVTDHGNIHATDAKEYAYGSTYDYGGLLSAFVRATKLAFSPLVGGIITVSKDHKQSLVKMGIEENKITPIYHGVDTTYTNIEETNKQAPFVLHVSSHGGKKNPNAVYEVASRLEYDMKIAGNGWEENAPKKIIEDESVELLGFVPEEELIELYNRASAFYLPTLYESFGLPLIEAMACGTAVVTTNVHAVPEVTGDAAIHRPPYDISKHVDELERLIEDDKYRIKRERQGLEWSSRFSWNRTARQTADVYREVLN